MSEEIGENTDRELWRKSDDVFAPSIFVTKGGCIGINVGGTVIVSTIEGWHETLSEKLPFEKMGFTQGAFGMIAPEDRAAFESPAPDAVGECAKRVEAEQANG